MIRNDAEYQEASKRLDEETQRLEQHRARLKETGLNDDEIERVIDPLASFHLTSPDRGPRWAVLPSWRRGHRQSRSGSIRKPWLTLFASR
jgi:hypothetical protein